MRPMELSWRCTFLKSIVLHVELCDNLPIKLKMNAIPITGTLTDIERNFSTSSQAVKLLTQRHGSKQLKLDRVNRQVNVMMHSLNVCDDYWKYI